MLKGVVSGDIIQSVKMATCSVAGLLRKSPSDIARTHEHDCGVGRRGHQWDSAGGKLKSFTAVFKPNLDVKREWM